MTSCRATAESGRKLTGADVIAECPWLARMDGETDLQIFARYGKQKIELYLAAVAARAIARAHGSNSEVMRKLESAERHARWFMQGAMELLQEELNKQPLFNQEL